MIFIYKLDPCSPEIHWICENELPMSRLSKLIVWQTDRQTEGQQTDGIEIIYHAASRLSIMWPSLVELTICMTSNKTNCDYAYRFSSFAAICPTIWTLRSNASVTIKKRLYAAQFSANLTSVTCPTSRYCLRWPPYCLKPGIGVVRRSSCSLTVIAGSSVRRLLLLLLLGLWSHTLTFLVYVW